MKLHVSIEKKNTEKLAKKSHFFFHFGSVDGVDVEKLYIVFHEVSNGKNSIDREAFQRALGKLEQFGLKRFKGLKKKKYKAKQKN